MKKIVVLGSKGMLGHVLTLYLKSKKYDVIEINRESFDIKDKNDIFRMINLFRDGNYIIVNCMGILVKASNDNPQLAKLINSDLPHILEQEFFDTKTRIIHISSDCVFTGLDNKSYTELDTPNETSVYGKTKAKGEVKNYKDLTIRTSIIGPELKKGTGLFKWFMNQKEKCNGYTNVYWNGLTTLELSKVIEKIINKKKLKGILNIYSSIISKYNLLFLIAKIFKKEINIESVKYEKNINKTLKSVYKHNIKVSNLIKQISEMKKWIENHKDLYKE